MGFDIHAWGYRGHKSGSKEGRTPFRYSKKDCLDQEDFEPPKLLAMIPDSPDAAGVAKKIVGTPEGHVGGAEVQGMMKIAEMIFAHQIVQGVMFLAMHGRAGQISVYCHQKKWYWADANSFVNCYLYGTNPGKEFLRSISPGLKKTELNNFGVLAQISIILSKYDRKLPKHTDANLRIEIRH
ncbi:MAG: hypothetical protein DWQ47_15955 [Acidobacteria bacterium]|nr:MAG: hypothetical protein DWQ32_03355 [Acidobacteriota bacterium]REK02449.1 MAG: hypothetical protein DWQ38_08780 [Acidobacteriota bacterium]REK13749.1 MAG: hypothetical protein DWQ43_09045 [Acidobacteriota bacterium]REK41743.1 MAG: hypothetical protein DWQ47_15955 [Acidobacteriota bacterium]